MIKKISLCLIGILFLLVTIGYIYHHKKNNYIYDDGVKLAVRIDGVSSNSFPNSGTYFVDVNCKNARGTWRKIADNNGQNESFKVFIDNITGDVSCNVDFTSNPSTLLSIVESETIDETDENAGYRYEGKTPANYIWFNNEMWRIIGSIPTKITANSNSNLVKIIRNYPINAAGHFDYFNTTFTSWSDSFVNTLLNTYYLNNQNATGTVYCAGNGEVYSNCNYTLKGLSNVTSMIENVYWNDGIVDTNDYSAGDIYELETDSQSFQAYVGLMSMSDFAYASNYGRANVSAYNTDNYRDSNWLFNSIDEWVFPNTIHTNTYNSSAIDNTGRGNYSVAMVGLPFRPVVYLDPSIVVVSGDGTESNPYQIVMN